MSQRRSRINNREFLRRTHEMQTDTSVQFSSVGGLSNHIESLKEMVIFPLKYPEIFKSIEIQPPRCCLFYGPPGTGKTLLAQALANECNTYNRRIAFFMRKGAEFKSKWAGEPEKQLTILFRKAYQMRPSIIFFDEIDCLAPFPTNEDYNHSSVASTLITLMDDMDDRQQIVVIGATNRIESVDPALRRPGRFDREFLFSLPDRDARLEIFKIHTTKWSSKPSEDLLKTLSEECDGYCGADIKSVCDEAVLRAAHRIYLANHAKGTLQLDMSSVTVTDADFLIAMQSIVPAPHRAPVSPGQALPCFISPLLQREVDNILKALWKVFPHAEEALHKEKASALPVQMLHEDLLCNNNAGSSVLESGTLHNLPRSTQKENYKLFQLGMNLTHQPISYRPRLLLAGRPGLCQGTYLAPAVLHSLKKFAVYTINFRVLFGAHATTPEDICAQLFHEAKGNAPSILYIPDINLLWETVSCTLWATLTTLLENIPSLSPILLLATCNKDYFDLPIEIQQLFPNGHSNVYHVQLPSKEDRMEFFKYIFLNQAALQPAYKKPGLQDPPASPSLEPNPVIDEEQMRLEEKEYEILCDLRLKYLNDVTHILAMDKRFTIFTKPLECGKDPDYIPDTAQPMDLSVMQSKISLQKYQTVEEYLKDFDLICSDAHSYNPDEYSVACALKDVAHAIINQQLDMEFVKACEEIQESRKNKGFSTSKRAMSEYHTHIKDKSQNGKKSDVEHSENEAASTAPVVASTSSAGFPASKHAMPAYHTRSKNKIQNGKKSDVEHSENEAASTAPVVASTSSAAKRKCTKKSCQALVVKRNYPLSRVIQCNAIDKQAKEGVVQDREVFTLNQSEKSPMDCESLTKEIEKDPHYTVSEGPVQQLGESAPENGYQVDANSESVPQMTHDMQVEQQHLISVDTDIHSQSTLAFLTDHEQLQALLDKAVDKSNGYDVTQLERLYAVLGHCIYRHRADSDKTHLLQEMDHIITYFKPEETHFILP